MRLCVSPFLLLVLSTGVISRSDANEAAEWTVGLRYLLKDCPPSGSRYTSGQREYLLALRRCVQRRAIAALDAALTGDVIPVVDGINLVRYEKSDGNRTDDEFHSEGNGDIAEKDIREVETSWQSMVLNRFARVLRTHVLKVDIDRLSSTVGLSSSDSQNISDDDAVQGRRRRRKRRHQMFPIMMMGFLLMASILIPMGFQFLAVLGGKALILAKMALVLSSIQGLKKIATNGVNYGLYHSPPIEGWHERSHHEQGTGFDIPYQGHPSPSDH